MGAIPFPSIREVVLGERGVRRELFIGQVEVRRRGFVTVLDGEVREGLVRENLVRRVGDPGIEWEIGCRCFFRFYFFLGLGFGGVFLKNSTLGNGRCVVSLVRLAG